MMPYSPNNLPPKLFTERELLSSIDTVTISTNFWRVPTVDGAFSGWLEGVPTPAERLSVIAAATAARAVWSPSNEGMALVEKMKSFVGHRIAIQFWDPCMRLFDNEAPYPVEADCTGVTLLQDGDFLQAYLEVANMREIPSADGFSPKEYFQHKAGSEYLLAPFADLYQVSKVVMPR